MPLKNLFTRTMSISEVKRQSIAYFSSTTVCTFLGFLSTIYFAHTIGPNMLGTYFIFIAYFGIIDMISDGGLGRAAIKRISEGEEQEEYYSAFFVLRTIITILIVASLIIFRTFISDPTNRQIFDWLILAQFVALFYCLVSKGIAGRGKMGIYAIGDLANNASRIIIQVVAIFLGYSMAGLVGGFIVGFAISAIIQLKFLDLHLAKFKWRHVKSLTAFSFWLFLTSTGVVLYSYADVIMIGYFIDNSSVGIYKVTFQLATFATIITAVISKTLWPKVSHWGKKGHVDSTETALTRAFTFSLLLALPILAGGILLGERMLYFFYGEEFALGHLTLVILLCAQLVNIFQQLFTMYLGALDKQKDSFKVTAVASIANVGLNIFMIPRLGIEGAAIATFISLGINAFLAMKILSTIMAIKIEKRSLINILKATIFMSIAVSIYKYFVLLDNIWLMLLPIIFGALLYMYLILKLDSKICDEFKDVATKLNIPWPRLL
ncbi:polysaccharide biosynthesis protein [Methanosarcina sp. 2.H.T.1A.6]|nr:polysaccharide biosynthesis protein [Methanosarcina sp. 2.H.T.1A.3]KKG18861.1 polysaccharide biosynthesis protein [Methanosarcina sp. 2.H.T.1A.15]KKG24057.1 polysaccharide biosynthesis protein [Methanosarcina sp. 2.H.T.1A.6]KKG25680.1 polysaccharide biosynthesis protein [Methanosarcina sp. 2.H.T.1A.8]